MFCSVKTDVKKYFLHVFICIQTKLKKCYVTSFSCYSAKNWWKEN